MNQTLNLSETMCACVCGCGGDRSKEQTRASCIQRMIFTTKSYPQPMAVSLNNNM